MAQKKKATKQNFLWVVVDNRNHNIVKFVSVIKLLTDGKGIEWQGKTRDYGSWQYLLHAGQSMLLITFAAGKGILRRHAFLRLLRFLRKLCVRLHLLSLLGVTAALGRHEHLRARARSGRATR